ncbi:MAG: hypothetical protein IPG55_17640 [Saprospiraceae bacterium]|jgi:diacylglycerol kinase (ATP)|nr:hypothetical protein [Candidatus Defluviibacterium haderslevense]MBK7242705.1 hypothetical protein [Candidatus Defluviibacterium haderslevense]
MAPTFVFIINPKSGSAKNKILPAKIKSFFKSDQFIIEFTEFPKHATVIASKYAEIPNHIIIAIGGDGTINEIAQALVNTSTKMGIIPTGSGNGFASHLKIPKNIDHCFKLIKNQHSILSDVIQVNDSISCNTAGLGFDAYVAKLFGNDGHRGFLSYMRLGLGKFKKSTAMNVTIGDATFKNILSLEIANSNQLGNNARISPHSNVIDGIAEVVLLTKPKWFQIPSILWAVFTGTFDHHRLGKIISYQNEVIRVDKPTDFHIDGEYKGEVSQVKFEVLTRKLHVICPEYNIHKI